MSAGSTIISTRSLTKRFRDLTAVSGVSIHVREGEIYGFVGLNGAGKTTTIRMLLGMIRPSGGSAALFGQEVGPGTDIWDEVGYLVEDPHAYPNLSVRENLEVCYRLRNLKDRGLVDEVIEQMHLGHYRNKKARHLSTGNMQRLGLAKALMHRPRLLILDEPVNGLDPAGIVEVRKLLRSLADQGTTIFLSSHILVEISRLADRVGIIHEGRVLKELDAGDLEHQLHRKLILRTDNNPVASALVREGGYGEAVAEQGCLSLTGEKAIASPGEVATLLVRGGIPPLHLRVEEENLEDFFLRIIGEEAQHG